MLDILSESLKKVFDKVKNISFLSDAEVNSILKEVQRGLIRSDVSIGVVTGLTDNVRKRLREEVKGLTKKQRLITLIYEEIVKVMGVSSGNFKVESKPFVIMLIGLFGCGKTTTTAKIAKLLKSEGYKVCMISTDNYRPAAFEQLRQLGEKVNVPIFGEAGLKDYLHFWKANFKNLSKYDIILVDTAGRDALHKDFILELKEQFDEFKPREVLLVLPADIGQVAESLTRKFLEVVDITGVIITKLDSSAKGGGALTSSFITKTPVRFITTGEGVDDIELFNVERFVSRLLGFGDLKGLLEKLEKQVDVGGMEDSAKKFMEGKVDFIDFYEQLEALNKMGGLKSVVGMLPQLGGLGKIDKSLFETSKDKLGDFRIILQSMTKEELNNPRLINSERIKRISQGSGKSEIAVRELIKSFNQINKFSKSMDKRQINKLMKRFGV